MELQIPSLRVDLLTGSDGNTRVRSTTYKAVPGITCDDLDELLDPGSWGTLTGDRMVMQRLDGTGPLTNGTSATYQETFTVAEGLYLTPRLICRRRALLDERFASGLVPRARALEYRLADPQSGGELIRIDQGSVVVREVREVRGEDDGVDITTTKRLRFAPPLDGPGLAIALGNLGYDEAFDDMVAAALAQQAAQQTVPPKATGGRGPAR